MDTQKAAESRAFEASGDEAVDQYCHEDVERSGGSGALQNMRNWLNAKTFALLLACSALTTAACEYDEKKVGKMTGCIESAVSKVPSFGQVSVRVKENGVVVMGNSPVPTRMFFKLYNQSGLLIDERTTEVPMGKFSIAESFPMSGNSLLITDSNERGTINTFEGGGIPNMPSTASANEGNESGEEESA